MAATGSDGARPRFLADAMVGRLARYLRFAGYDTEYGRGVDDTDLALWAARDGRILLTRDRRLAASTPTAVLIASPRVGEQIRALRAAIPNLDLEVEFARCGRCNGELATFASTPDEPWPTYVPDGVRQAGGPVFRCARCGQFFWEGSHTRRIRTAFAEWTRPGP
ncbi:MAG TPA: Mut7-C RNAse domain-containing protein [Thermoplasmata archaeon]|nr:Mut7-C RNAse domain-containing protein [Thermoplasmata archaeon]